MQTNAPGRGKLKVTGILYIIFGALGMLLSLALLAGGGLLLAAGAGTVGIALGAVAGILGAITVLTAVFYLILGILGVRNCDKPEKCGVNFVLGIIVLVLVVIGLVALFKSEVLLSILPVIIGLIILMDGLVTINQALNLRKLDYRWKYLLPMGIVVAVFGLVLVLNPFGSAMLLMRFLGFTLLVDGFCDFWWYYRLKKLFE